MGVEVVGSREREVPIFSRPDISAKTEILRNLAVVLHFFFIEIAVRVAYRVVDTQAPRNLPFHIPVAIEFVAEIFFLAIVPVGRGVSVIGRWRRFVVAVAIVFVFVLGFALEGVVVEGI